MNKWESIPVGLENLFIASSVISKIRFDIISSQIGLRKIIINDKDSISTLKNATRLRIDDPYTFNIFSQLDEYFERKRKKFDVSIDIHGTENQLKIWNEILKIYWGETRSYEQLAEKIGNKKAIRAVGRIVGSNPLPIVIPCHRIIGKNGKLTGYSGGIKVKERLLELEGSLSLDLFEQK